MDATAKALEKLPPDKLEELTLSLLNREGYMNCSWQQREGEAARDIVCYRFTVDGPPELFQKFVVLCKPDKSSLSKYRLTKDIQTLRQYAPYCAIFVSMEEVSDYKRKAVSQIGDEEENDFKILLWEKDYLLSLVEKHQDLRWHYLGIGIDDLFGLPAIKNVMIRNGIENVSEKVQALLKHTYEKCIRKATAATNTALLASYMEKSADLMRQAAAGDRRVEKEMGELLEEVLENQGEIDFPEEGVRLTDEFVRTLLTADRLARAIHRPVLDEQVLLYAMFKTATEGVIAHLTRKFSADLVQSMEGTLLCSFDIDEQDLLKRFFISCAAGGQTPVLRQEGADGDDLQFENFDFCIESFPGAERDGPPAEFMIDLTGYAEAADVEAEYASGREGGPYPGSAPVTEPGHPPERFYRENRFEFVQYPKRPRMLPSYSYQYDMLLDNWFSRMMSYLLSHHKKLTDILIFPEKPIQIRDGGRLAEVTLDSFLTSFSHFQTEAIACMLLNKTIVKGLMGATHPNESISFVYQMKGHQYFRVTIMTNAMGVSIAFRKIYPPLWSGENLFSKHRLLSSLEEFEDGVVLVAGKPASGKTTFMNAMVNEVNQKRRATIVTLEDPIETFHAPACASILQLQKGVHFSDYQKAAFHSIKSCADLIVIDELKDDDTCKACFDPARLGMLTVATISAGSCKDALSSIFHMCGAEKDQHFKGFVAKVLKRIIFLELTQDTKESVFTSFEALDFSREVEARRAAFNPVNPGSDAPANCAVPSIDDLIASVFSPSSLKSA